MTNTILVALHKLTYLIFIITLPSRCYYYSHFIYERTKTEKDLVTSQLVTEEAWIQTLGDLLKSLHSYVQGPAT